MLERTNIDGNKVIVEVFRTSDDSYGVRGETVNDDESDDEDLTSLIYHC